MIIARERAREAAKKARWQAEMHPAQINDFADAEEALGEA